MTIDGIVLENPEIWWPNTYSEQPLYMANVTVSNNGAVEDRTSFKFGVREFTYPIDGNRLSIYCNGTRIYFPNSASDPVGSGGGYAIAAMPNRNNGTGIGMVALISQRLKMLLRAINIYLIHRLK